MQGAHHTVLVSRAKKLGQNNGGAGADADKKAVDHIHQRPCGAHGGQRFGADKAADDNGICGVIHLLEKGAQQNGKEKDQDLPEDRPLRDLPDLGDLLH